MVLFNFSVPKSQNLPADAKEGWFLVTQDPKGYPADIKTLPGQWKNLVYIASILTTEERTALLTLLGLDNATLKKLIEDNSVDTVSLGDIPIGAVDDTQRAKLRSALQLIDDSVPIKGILADDRTKFIYAKQGVYGIKRLLYSDVTSRNQRTGYEGSNEARPINGTGSADFSNATNQWYTIFFNARNVFRIVLRHTNSGVWKARKLEINQASKTLTGSAGTYIFTYTPLPSKGWESVSRIQFVDDGGDTILEDLQVWYSNPVAPLLTNGQTLQVNDYFKIENDRDTYQFNGIDSASGAWKASVVTSNLSIDALLSETSTNAIQNRTVYWGLEELKQSLTELINDQSIATEISTYINRQLLANALMIDRLQVLFNEVEQIKERLK